MPGLVEIGAAPLEMVAFSSELLDPLINRHDTAHLVADALGILIGKQEIAVRHGMPPDNGGYLPLRERMANLMSRNLWGEADSSFGIGGRSSAALLVTGLAGKDEHRLLGVEKHGAVENDILMHSYGDFFQCSGNEFPVRHGFQQIAAYGIEKVKFSFTCRLDHLRYPEYWLGRERVAPQVREAAGAFVSEWKSACERDQLGPACAAPLDVAVTTDWHD